MDGLLLDVSVMARNSGSSCNLDSVRDSLAEAGKEFEQNRGCMEKQSKETNVLSD